MYTIQYWLALVSIGAIALAQDCTNIRQEHDQCRRKAEELCAQRCTGQSNNPSQSNFGMFPPPPPQNFNSGAASSSSWASADSFPPMPPMNDGMMPPMPPFMNNNNNDATSFQPPSFCVMNVMMRCADYQGPPPPPGPPPSRCAQSEWPAFHDCMQQQRENPSDPQCASVSDRGRECRRAKCEQCSPAVRQQCPNDQPPDCNNLPEHPPPPPPPPMNNMMGGNNGGGGFQIPQNLPTWMTGSSAAMRG